MTNQLRRAAVSVSTNIAEGRGRGTRRDYANFLSMALGSLAEVESLLEVSYRLGYVASSDLRRLIAEASEIGKMLNTIRTKLVQA
jgi:four helix bundle protein